MAEIATKEDIENLFERFKSAIIAEIESRWSKNNSAEGKWMRSKDVKAVLKISDSTLQRMRVKSLITFKKIGGIYLYDLSKLK